MAKQRARKIDIRELPAYTIADAAHYLGVPAATTRYWATGQDSYAALIDVPNHQPTLLSFLNLVELHVLAAIRRKHTVTMPKVRSAIDYLRKHTRSAADRKHPLISKHYRHQGEKRHGRRYRRGFDQIASTYSAFCAAH